YTFTVTGRAIAPTPSIAYAAVNNNFGGAEPGSTTTIGDYLTVTNSGAQDLVFTPSLIKGNGDFSLGGLAGVTQMLAPRSSMTIPVSFVPSKLGLRPGTIRITTNDPDHPVTDLGVVGTGIPKGGIGPNDFTWGNDYVALKTGNFTQRVRSNQKGDFMA